MTLLDLHRAAGATLAQDGIPLHYGDLAAEYQAALHHAIVLDRSHEGRIHLFGADRQALLNRMSTARLVNMAPGEGRVTIFTSPTARILERVSVYNRDDHLLLITEPGRGPALLEFLQRHIFFNDKVEPVDVTAQTAQLALHGPAAAALMAELAPALATLPPLYSHSVALPAATFVAARRITLAGSHWVLLTTTDAAAALYQAVMQAGHAHGLRPAGSLTYNTLRIRAGYPAGREISQDYLPLEVGLWDAVSFDKGCYTGQEIIARMESRQRIARTLVHLALTDFVAAPAPVFMAGNAVGTLTSSVQAPDGAIFALAVLKIAAARPGTALTVGEGGSAAVVSGLPGAQPPYLTFEAEQDSGS